MKRGEDVLDSMGNQDLTFFNGAAQKRRRKGAPRGSSSRYEVEVMAKSAIVSNNLSGEVVQPCSSNEAE